MTDKQIDIINHIWAMNGEEYNLMKASEECQELGLALVQKVLKPKKTKDQEVIDEIGDVMIRLEILKKIYPMEEIEKRIDYKLSKFRQYIDHQMYSKI